jgi:glycosyltransferase involved in cell wall biosynthesis
VRTLNALRVAIIHPFLFRYARGIERFTFNLANVLARGGIEVNLLTWRWQSPIQIDALDANVRVHFFPTTRYYSAQAIVPFYVAHLQRHRYDFVWIYFAGYGEAEALSLLRRQQFGIVFHYPYCQVAHRYREFLRYGLAQRAAHLVSVSRLVSEGVRESLGRTSTVIHHGVDAQLFKPDSGVREQLRSALNLSTDAPVLLTAAALEERKGVQCVLASLPHILREFPDVMYLVVGDGPYRATLETRTRELGLGEHVRFLGPVANVAPYYQAADVSLILARGEASSLMALESLSCGVPVIAADQPPFDELITPDCGVMVDETDAQQVAKVTIDLLTDSSKRKSLGAAGRTKIQSDFTWAQVGEKYARLLDGVSHTR